MNSDKIRRSTYKPTYVCAVPVGNVEITQIHQGKKLLGRLKQNLDSLEKEHRKNWLTQYA